jgi:hypothetical protein
MPEIVSQEDESEPATDSSRLERIAPDDRPVHAFETTGSALPSAFDSARSFAETYRAQMDCPIAFGRA